MILVKLKTERIAYAVNVSFGVVSNHISIHVRF